jgi:hypothetical protein
MSNRLARAYGRNLVWQVVLGAIVIAVAVPALGCLILGLTLLPEDLIGRDSTVFVCVGALVTFVLAAIGAVAAYVLLVVNRRVYAQLDGAFTPFGLAGSRYLLTGRQYQGTYRGRQVTVHYYVSGTRFFRSPNMQVDVSGNIRTRLGIGERNALSNLGAALGRVPELTTDDPAYQGLAVYAADEGWARGLLADPLARGAVERLAGQAAPGETWLAFNPAGVQLHLRYFELAQITLDAVSRWLKDLAALAEIAEGLPPPAQVEEAAQWERAGQSGASQVRLIALAVVGAIVLCPTAAIVFTVVVLLAFGALQ